MPARRIHGGERSGPPDGLRLGDGDRPGQRVVRAGSGHLARGGKAPGTADPHPHADPLAQLVGGLLDRAVANGHQLAPVEDVARLGIGDAAVDRAHEVDEQVEHGAAG